MSVPPLLLASVALLAAYLPAARTTRIQPVEVCCVASAELGEVSLHTLIRHSRHEALGRRVVVDH
jgi:hypothetical protein